MGYNLKADDISKITTDLNTLLVGGRVRGVYQPLRDELYLEIYLKQRTLLLLISIENGFNRIYITDSKPENPQNPFSFQMLLRKYILPSYITEIVQINNDRVVKIELAEFKIYAELTGRHANIFLTDSQEIILGSMRENVSQKRPLFPSNRYIPPFQKEIRDISSHKIPDGIDIQSYFSEFYKKIMEEHRLTNLKSKLTTSLNKEISHLHTILRKINEDKNKALRYEEYFKYAEALKQNNILEMNNDYIRCKYYTESGVEIVNIPPIKGKKIFELMEHYFRLYKRYKNSLNLIYEREKEIADQLQKLQSKIDEIQKSEDIQMLNIMGTNKKENRAIKVDLQEEGKIKLPFKTYYVEGVGKIYSGSDAVENEQLTFKYSRGNDLWFHIIGYSGSHVVLPVSKDKIPSEKQINAAALLAAARSSAPDGETVEVAYTRVKYVRRVRGGTKGAVTFSNEKRILVKVDKRFFQKCILLS